MPILDALLKNLEVADKPEKVAENDYIMKCAFHLPLPRFSTPLYLDG